MSGSLARGILMAIGLGVGALVLLVGTLPLAYLIPGVGVLYEWLGILFIGGATFIGVTQLLYIVPLVLQAQRAGQAEYAKGLMIGASLLFVLNAACTFLIFNPLQR